MVYEKQPETINISVKIIILGFTKTDSDIFGII